MWISVRQWDGISQPSSRWNNEYALLLFFSNGNPKSRRLNFMPFSIGINQAVRTAHICCYSFMFDGRARAHVARFGSHKVHKKLKLNRNCSSNLKFKCVQVYDVMSPLLFYDVHRFTSLIVTPIYPLCVCVCVHFAAHFLPVALYVHLLNLHHWIFNFQFCTTQKCLINYWWQKNKETKKTPNRKFADARHFIPTGHTMEKKESKRHSVAQQTIDFDVLAYWIEILRRTDATYRFVLPFVLLLLVLPAKLSSNQPNESLDAFRSFVSQLIFLELKEFFLFPQHSRRSMNGDQIL